MIPVNGLVFIAAFFLAEEKKRGEDAYTGLDSLKKLLADTVQLSWQLGFLILLCLGARQAEVRLPQEFYFEKGLCAAGAYLLSKIHGKTPVYFTVLAALSLGASEQLSSGWRETLIFFGQVLGGCLGFQVLYLGLKERLLLARVPAAMEGLPLAFLSYFLILFAVWATGFFCLS